MPVFLLELSEQADAFEITATFLFLVGFSFSIGSTGEAFLPLRLRVPRLFFFLSLRVRSDYATTLYRSSNGKSSECFPFFRCFFFSVTICVCALGCIAV